MNHSIFAWNCQGAASGSFHRILRSLLKGYRPHIVILVEPRISGKQADKAIRKINYPYSHRIEATGFSGGIWLLWKDDVNMKILHNHKQFMHALVTDPLGVNPYMLTDIYGSPNASLRERLWSDLLNLHVPSEVPWLLAGDFNATTQSHERKGGSNSMRPGCRSSNNFLSCAGLIDLGFKGPTFTWKRGSQLVRLDRALCNQEWLTQQPNTEVMHLLRIQSDHRPLLITPVGEQSASQPPFRFLASWVTHADFKNQVSKSWSHNRCLAKNIEQFSSASRCWNVHVFGNIGRNKRRLRNRLNAVQMKLEQHHFSPHLIDIEKTLLLEYENVCY